MSDLPQFFKFPKIPRYENEIFTISEKIDGSNGVIYVSPEGEIVAGCRTRWLIDDGSKTWDNHGFAAWVKENSEDLVTHLKPGTHYGEWYGKGINRNYGLQDRKFMLFNRVRYAETPECSEVETVLDSNVPAENLDSVIKSWSSVLLTNGSVHVPGFSRPEGLIVRSNLYHNHLYKVILDK